MENYLTDLMFDLPDLPHHETFTVDEEFIKQRDHKVRDAALANFPPARQAS
ncbi:MAG: hypothetical protein LBP75_09965 [Planctomycetota bacterium]|jgi:ATP-dependent protease Clp ATPase subunit|nr:hypothetical protein [Planctomycetota bacterium]